jgi:hypothetical protein
MKTMKSVAGALAGLVFLVLAACATSGEYAYKPWGTSITDPGEVYSTWKWGKEIEAGLIDAGRGQEIETIKARYTEEGWPEKLASFDARVDNPKIIKEYRAETIATFRNGDTPLVVLRVPADQNKHMPEGWRPAQDIYIVIKQSAVAGKK